MSRKRFQRYAVGLLVYNLAVILGGAFVRASLSGDGCGAHWPTCNGALIPEGGLAAAIEYGHRLSTGILLPLVIALVVAAHRTFPAGHLARRGAWAVLGYTLAEAAVGAGLVLFRWVAHDRSVERAIAMPLHLIVTFNLLAALTMTVWGAGGGQAIRWRGQGMLGWSFLAALGGTLLLGVTGALTALGDTLFRVQSHAESKALEAAGAHFTLQLRVFHPVMAIAVGLYLAAVAGYCLRTRPEAEVQRWARATICLFSVQMLAGAVNYALLAPIWMQLLHLLLADLFWISLVLLTAATLSPSPASAPAASTVTPVPAAQPSRQAAEPRPAPVPRTAATPRWKLYLALTKPRVISLLLFTTLAAMYIAADGQTVRAPSLWLVLATGLGLYMAAGAANAINMVLERDLDERMGRTAGRPTVTQSIPPASALRFAAALAVGSFLLLTAAANLLAALMALAGLAFYVVVYTLLLKRRTRYNIVIGGAAGAFPPLVGWAAVTGDLSPLAWCLFGIIFLWTPVHFWALALLIKDDYARAGVPMLPVVGGVRATVVQIACYAVLTVGISAVPLWLAGGRGFGWFYVSAALLLNGMLLLRTFRLYRRPEGREARSLFHYSMVYLALLFLAMAVDRAPWL